MSEDALVQLARRRQRGRLLAFGVALLRPDTAGRVRAPEVPVAGEPLRRQIFFREAAKWCKIVYGSGLQTVFATQW
jgi:hypothetical protein